MDRLYSGVIFSRWWKILSRVEIRMLVGRAYGLTVLSMLTHSNTDIADSSY